jgi:hypothetical protein
MVEGSYGIEWDEVEVAFNAITSLPDFIYFHKRVQNLLRSLFAPTSEVKTPAILERPKLRD